MQPLLEPPPGWRRLVRLPGPQGQRFNTWSHVLGLALCIGGMPFLVVRCRTSCDAAAAGGTAVFAATALLLFCASVFCHASRTQRQQLLWRRIDHAATYLLIAGSYTPFATAQPRQAVHLVALALVWAGALALSARELLDRHAGPPALGAYVVLGWTSVAAAMPVAWLAGPAAFAWLLAGAFLYSVGTVFYRNKAGWAHAHGTWHLLVVGGVTAHAAAVFGLPPA
jgi:hemolysin III